MTIQFDIILKKSSGDTHLTVLEVSESGIQDYRKGTHLMRNGEKIEYANVHRHKALLLVEGMHDFTDGTQEDHRYSVFNPLVEYLNRDNPTITLHDELRAKLAKAQKDRDEALLQNVVLTKKLDEIKKAIGLLLP